MKEDLFEGTLRCNNILVRIPNSRKQRKTYS